MACVTEAHVILVKSGGMIGKLLERDGVNEGDWPILLGGRVSTCQLA